MPRHCLIVLQTPPVAQDLALTLRDLTGAEPILADTLADAFEALTDKTMPPGALSCAVLQTNAAGLCANPLCQRLRDLGTPVVLMGHAAEMELAQGSARAEWPVLPQPFGPAQVAEALRMAGALGAVAAVGADSNAPHPDLRAP